MTVSFIVPGVPRGKQRPRFVRATGNVYTPEQTRSYESQVRGFAFEAMQGKVLMTGPVSVTMTAKFLVPKSYSRKKTEAALAGWLYPPRPDLDQLEKSCLDGMNSVVFADDAQVVMMISSKGYGEVAQLKVAVTEFVRIDAA